uniref:Uncharacterized protein n=1 Tax=Meloidogyne javanica TaxID=6303 RepID=A0A915LMJ7_MELJA
VKFDTKIAAGKAIAEMNNGEFLGQTGAAPKEVPGIFNPATAGVNPSTVAAVNSAQMQQYWQYYQQCQQNPQWASYFQGQQK